MNSSMPSWNDSGVIGEDQGWPNQTYFYVDDYDEWGNFSGNDTQQEALSKGFKIACFCLYAIIFVLGMVGNLLFCYIVISSRSMKNITYHLLVNLSVSDLLITCLCGPLQVSNTLVLGYWPFGWFMCICFSYFQGISILVSSFSLVVISFERYMSILHPLKPVIPRAGSLYVIVGVWLVSLAASIPLIIQTKHVEIEMGVWVCSADVDLFFHISSVLFTIIQYFLPVVLMTYFYSMVAKTIWSRRDICELMDGTSHKAEKELQMLKSKRKMIKMLIVVVACYTICWIPFNIFWVLLLIWPSLEQSTWYPYIFTAVHILAVSHTCINPVIYCWMNRRVRYGFMDIVGKLKLVRDCFPKIDWDGTHLTRNARQTQFTVVRKRRTGNVSGLNSPNTLQRGESADTFSIRSGYGRGQLHHQSTVSLTTLGRMDSRASGLGSRLDDIPTHSNSTNNGRGRLLHKTSTVSCNGEMAQLLREEPLLHRVQNAKLQRQQKISTISTSTSVTNVSDEGPATPILGGNGGTTTVQTFHFPRHHKISREMVRAELAGLSEEANETDDETPSPVSQHEMREFRKVVRRKPLTKRVEVSGDGIKSSIISSLSVVCEEVFMA
ncbi:RYamide receptor-like isoform X2 [Tigriopus californicus]|uniref:RYamide receptor-like isoform X2 n=1 Tax=Tigriopus californicus TaxID=6832 RepID=UPI0027DA0FC6|nr:RYamide receptor-like isoform X2 [Tigriopus californicus]